MVNYYSSANVGSPQHFILLQIIMIWKGQVPTVITQSDKRNQTSVRLNDNTLQLISSLESINLFHMRAPTRFFFLSRYKVLLLAVTLSHAALKMYSAHSLSLEGSQIKQLSCLVVIKYHYGK